MQASLEHLNWAAIGVSVVVGQIVLTVWFTALFGAPWARAYGAADQKQHTKEVPGYTYAIGVGCTLLLTLGLAVLEAALGVSTAAEGLGTGLFVAVCFTTATALPGYAFLRRWSAFFLAIGSQTVLILLVSLILASWQ